jgi:hypothetical protein
VTELENEILESKSGTSHSRISVDLLLFPHNQTSILLETVAAKWEPLAGDELDGVGSAADGVFLRVNAYLGSNPRATEST